MLVCVAIAVPMAALQTQTIAFTPLPNIPLPNPPLQLHAAASSDLTVAFNSQTPAFCTVSGTQVTPIGAGTCTVQATQAGDASFDPASPVTQSFTITASGGYSCPAFFKTKSITVATAGSDVQVADFNGDGNLDLVYLVATTGMLEIALGNGNGTFRTPVTVDTTSSPGLNCNSGACANITQFAAGDLNNDGLIDLVYATNANEGRVMLGAEDGTFTGPSGAVLLTNFPKIALAYTGGSSTAIFYSAHRFDTFLVNGISLVSASTVDFGNVGFSWTKLIAADLNHDGRDDLLFLNAGGPSITEIVADACTYDSASCSGQLIASTAELTFGTQIADFAVADLDNDGERDILTTGGISHGFSVRRGSSDGTFAAATTTASGGTLSLLALADFDGDTKLDFIVGDGRFYKGNDDATFTEGAQPLPNGITTSNAYDFDGDGFPDFAQLGSPGVQIILNTSGCAPLITSADFATFDSEFLSTFTITTMARPPVTTFTETGSLPAGVTFDTVHGELSGTPTALGDFPITLTASNSIVPNASQPFTLTVQTGPPIVDNISPNRGPVAGGQTVTITGKNLADPIFVSLCAFGANLISSTPTTIVIVTLAADGPESVPLYVTTAAGGTTIEDAYTYVEPAISFLTPNKGPVAGNTSVTITGTDLDGATSVTFGGVAANITNNTSTTVTVTTPAHANPGLVDVAVTTPYGVGTRLNGFTYTGASPANLVATYTTGTNVSLSWTASTGATMYEVVRFPATASALTTSNSAVIDTTVTPGAAYLYKVRAIAPTPTVYSNTDLATAVTFTDVALIPGITRIKAVHFTQLLNAVNAVRTLAGLVVADPTVSVNSTIKRSDLTGLRDLLDEARSHLLLPAISYTRPTITAGSTTVATVDVLDLRIGVR
jgi:hypothetical protein